MPKINQEQIATLRAAAEAAHRPGVFWYEQDRLEQFTGQFTGPAADVAADAAYIAGSTPGKVLALIDRIDELERERDYANDYAGKVNRQIELVELAAPRGMTGDEVIALSNQITKQAHVWTRPGQGAEWVLVPVQPGNSRGIEYGMKSWEFFGPVTPPAV